MTGIKFRSIILYNYVVLFRWGHVELRFPPPCRFAPWVSFTKIFYEMINTGEVAGGESFACVFAVAQALWPFPFASQGKGCLMDLVCKCDGLFSLPVEEK